jgi:predicted solute-binding protein
MSDDVEALCDVLMTANKGENPRLTQKELETYIEDETTDIEALFAQVVDFFGKANATKMIYKELQSLTEMEKK